MIDEMKQALEALKFGLHVGFDESSESQIKKCGKAFDQHNKAIAALRQAIEQAEKQDADEWYEKALWGEKQEPVAWMSPNKERLEFSRKDTVYGSHTIPLYTAPPKRERNT